DYISNNAIIVVDEYNRVKDTEETLMSEVNDFMQQLIESGKGFIGQYFLDDDAFENLIKTRNITYFTLFTASMPVKLDHIIK
ncbi:hypothetical protein NL503_29200, partial [Klebsiella pneumoniae]|nr:hypothetical protein [Klebsiella pneumoniae]